MNSGSRILLVLVASLLAAAGGALTAQHLLGRDRAPLHATLLEPPRPLPAFELIDHDGADFDHRRLERRWSILFFGFTHCPDICPTTLQTLAETVRLLRERDDEAPQVVFVSVDPQRDSPARLADYVPYFDRRFIGVTGAPEAIEQLTRELGVAVSIHADPQQPERYSVDHSAALFLIDPRGRLRAVFSAPHEARRIADDYHAISSG